jgi:organic hydroperoxide reductase OsmC/OhrA
MQAYPHHYRVTASAHNTGPVTLQSPGLPAVDTAPPAEFGGPGDVWSPETLLAAAVADCFVLSFKAIARASSMEWTSLTCNVEAILDRVDKITQFTEFHLTVQLEVPTGTDETKALRLLDKAESACLITNSLKSSTHLQATVVTVNSHP